jgi:hypothetical protein
MLCVLDLVTLFVIPEFAEGKYPGHRASAREPLPSLGPGYSLARIPG